MYGVKCATIRLSRNKIRNENVENSISQLKKIIYT